MNSPPTSSRSLRALYGAVRREVSSFRFALGLAASRRRRALAMELVRGHEWFHSNSSQNLMGSLTDQDLDRLRSAIEQSSQWSGPIVEIGCLFGFTTQFIATVKSPERQLITVDNFSWNPFQMHPDMHRAFTRRALGYCLAEGSTRIFDGSSREFYASYSGPVPSMVFIDGDHTYQAVYEDLSRAIKAGIPVLSGHDYAEVHPGVQRAVDELVGKQPVIEGSTVWIARNPRVLASSARVS